MTFEDGAPAHEDDTHLHVGRPRSASADAAILIAAVELLGEVGYRAMAMEAVASRAGVSKATVYRRYPDKEALVTGVLAHLGGLPPVAAPAPGPADTAASPGTGRPPAGNDPVAGAGPSGIPAGLFMGMPPAANLPAFASAPVWPVPGAEMPGGPSSARDMLASSLRMASRAVSNPSWLPILGAMLVEVHHEGGLADAVRTRIFEPSDAAIRAIVEAGVASGELSPEASPEAISDALFGSLVARSMLRKPITDSWIDAVVDSLLCGVSR